MGTKRQHPLLAGKKQTRLLQTKRNRQRIHYPKSYRSP